MIKQTKHYYFMPGFWGDVVYNLKKPMQVLKEPYTALALAILLALPALIGKGISKLIYLCHGEKITAEVFQKQASEWKPYFEDREGVFEYSHHIINSLIAARMPLKKVTNFTIGIFSAMGKAYPDYIYTCDSVFPRLAAKGKNNSEQKFLIYMMPGTANAKAIWQKKCGGLDSISLKNYHLERKHEPKDIIKRTTFVWHKGWGMDCAREIQKALT
jgi:hypothetical protein